MAIYFPASPTNGQTFVVCTVTYTYDGIKWTAKAIRKIGQLPGALIFKGSKAPGDAAPGTPNSGDIWVMSAAGKMAASWTGVAGLDVVKDETIAWDGSEWISLGFDPQLWTRTGTVLSPATAGDAVDIDFPLGTAALPGLTPVGDPDSGLLSPGADQVAVSTGGSERLRVTAAGNVGIGSTLSGNANNRLLVRSEGVSAITDVLLLLNGAAANNAGQGVRLNL